MKVLAKGTWAFGGGIMPGQKLEGQVTKLQLDDVIFYVRENLNGADSFHVSSPERWAEKGGNNADRGPRSHRQILDLCAPDEHWDRLAALVHEADSLKRQVRRHRTFTTKWAEEHLG